jgi:hypothetical protein
VQAVFNAAPNFINLRFLEVSGWKFTEACLGALSRIKSPLSTLIFMQCDVEAKFTTLGLIPARQLKELFPFSHSALWEVAISHHLRHVSIQMDMFQSFVSIMKGHVDVMELLVTLELDAMSSRNKDRDLRSLRSALPLFRSLKRFRCSGIEFAAEDNQDDWLPVDALPALESVECRLNVLPLFTLLRPLKQLRLSEKRGMPVQEALSKHRHMFSQVETLRLSLAQITSGIGLFTALRKECSRLEDLTVDCLTDPLVVGISPFPPIAQVYQV